MKKVLYSFLFFLALAAVSCNKDVTVYGVGASDRQIEIGAYSGKTTKSPVTGTTMPTGRTIVFSAYYNAAEGTSANYFTGINFTRSSSNIWTATKYWPLSGTLDFLGYCLDNNSRVSSVTWGANNCASVSMALSNNASNQDDLLVGGASALTSSSHSVVFKHAEALLMFNAASSVAYNSSTNYGITITDIKVNNAYHSGTVTATRSGSDIAFAWSSLGSQANVTLPGMTATNLSTTMSAIGGTPGMLVPGQTETSFTIYYTLHNGKDSSSNNVDNILQYTYTPASPKTWQPGYKYIYNITMTLTGIEITTSVTDWIGAPATAVAIP